MKRKVKDIPKKTKLFKCEINGVSYKIGDTNRLVQYTFDSIGEYISWIQSHNPVTTKRSSENGSYHFTGTNSYSDALELLEKGWEEGAQKIDKRLKEKLQSSMEVTTRQRSVYDVVGGNASVPRYLQGVPTNMIRQVRTPVKQPVTNVYFNYVFPQFFTQDQIIDECIKTLQKVVALENAGTRVNLYAIKIAGTDNGTVEMVSVCLKKSTERLNVLKLAFPVAHPSMLRRISFAFDERNPDLPKTWCTDDHYGKALVGEDNINVFFKNIQD